MISLCLLALFGSSQMVPLARVADGPGKLVRLTAPTKVSLASDRVTLGLLLKPDPANPELTAQLDEVVLTAAPPPGQMKTVAAAEILRRLEAMGVTSRTHSIAVPAEIAITREARMVTVSEISEHIVQEFLPGLPWKDARLERIDVTEVILLPLGKTEWIFHCRPGTDLAKPFYLNINFSVDGEVVKRAFVRTVLSLHEEVAVAIAELKPTRFVREEDLRWETQRLMSTLHPLVKSSRYFHGRRPRQPIPPGQVLTENLFVEVPSVMRGDRLLLVFESDSLRVSTQAKALAAGFRGQRIQVMNTDSGKVLSAEITGEGTARVAY
jgi:flagella basal body P-ring formation protein FlgA